MALERQVLERTTAMVGFFAATWHEERPPIRIHSSVFAEDGTPQWDPGFLRWITGTKRNSERRLRLTQAMRLLRQYSIREYEVAYRAIVQGEDLDKVAAWLTERAIRNEKPERYRISDAQAILCSAVDKDPGMVVEGDRDD